MSKGAEMATKGPGAVGQEARGTKNRFDELLAQATAAEEKRAEPNAAGFYSR